MSFENISKLAMTKRSSPYAISYNKFDASHFKTVQRLERFVFKSKGRLKRKVDITSNNKDFKRNCDNLENLSPNINTLSVNIFTPFDTMINTSDQVQPIPISKRSKFDGIKGMTVLGANMSQSNSNNKSQGDEKTTMFQEKKSAKTKSVNQSSSLNIAENGEDDDNDDNNNNNNSANDTNGKESNSNESDESSSTESKYLEEFFSNNNKKALVIKQSSRYLYNIALNEVLK